MIEARFLICKILKSSGVGHVFGVSGGRILPLIDALFLEEGIEFHHARTEVGAAFMGEAYARIRGLGCCIATSGPGALGLLNGVASAYYDSIPLIAITGQTESWTVGKGGIQESSGYGRSPNVSAMFSSVTKYSSMIRTVEQIIPALLEAIQISQTGRPGPVHLDIPCDLFGALVNPVGAQEKGAQGSRAGALQPPLGLGPRDSTAQALLSIRRAERVALVLGAGSCSLSPLDKEFLSLHFPFAVSLAARGQFDEHHPNFLGQIGVYGQDVANGYLLNEADLIIFMGVSFQYLTCIGWHERLKSKIALSVNIGREENLDDWPLLSRIEHTCAEFTAELREALNPPSAETSARGQNRIKALKETHGFFPFHNLLSAMRSREPYFDLASLWSVLNSRLVAGDMVCLDSGENAYWAMMSLQVGIGTKFLVNAGLGSMGYAIPAAVAGAKVLASVEGEQSVAVAIVGDGGFLMSWQELTCSKDQLNSVVVIVLDNKNYGTQAHWVRDHYRLQRENSRGLERELEELSTRHADLTAVSLALGLEYSRPKNADQLAAALSRARSARNCQIIHLEIDPEIKPCQALGSNLKK